MRHDIYFAGPLFTAAEQHFNEACYCELSENGLHVFLPQRECAALTDAAQIQDCCVQGLRHSKIVLAVLDGADADSGTAWECGYATALGMPVVGLRTDFRQQADDGGLNLMLSRSCVQLFAPPVNTPIAEMMRQVLPLLQELCGLKE